MTAISPATIARIVSGSAGSRRQVERHADGDEEQAEQQPLERLDVRLQFMPVLAVGEQHAGEEGAQGRRQPETLHQQRGAHHGEQGKRREHLLHRMPATTRRA